MKQRKKSLSADTSRISAADGIVQSQYPERLGPRKVVVESGTPTTGWISHADLSNELIETWLLENSVDSDSDSKVCFRHPQCIFSYIFDPHPLILRFGITLTVINLTLVFFIKSLVITAFPRYDYDSPLIFSFSPQVVKNIILKIIVTIRI